MTWTLSPNTINIRAVQYGAALEVPSDGNNLTSPKGARNCTMWPPGLSGIPAYDSQVEFPLVLQNTNIDPFLVFTHLLFHIM